jgi:hypothetical protein
LGSIRICKVDWWYEGEWHSTFYRSEPEARARMREMAPEPGMKDSLSVVEVEPTVDGIVHALNRYFA